MATALWGPVRMSMAAILILVLALLWDLAWGEMPAAIHPVVLMGRMIRRGRDWGLRRQSPRAQFLAGIMLVGLMPCLFAGSAWLLIASATKTHVGLGIIVQVYLLKSAFAFRALHAAGEELCTNLGHADLAGARKALRSLCSRDAQTLSSEELAAATVASLAENLCDSIIAPLLAFVIAGVPGAIFYRVVNTMDAIIGYRGRLEYLGKAAARLDDLLNFVPARLSAVVLALSGQGIGYQGGRAFKLAWNQHGRTPSPNGGWPMATIAGLLDIALVKKDCYTLGRAVHPAAPRQIRQALELLSVATAVGSGLCILILYIFV